MSRKQQKTTAAKSKSKAAAEAVLEEVLRAPRPYKPRSPSRTLTQQLADKHVEWGVKQDLTNGIERLERFINEKCQFGVLHYVKITALLEAYNKYAMSFSTARTLDRKIYKTVMTELCNKRGWRQHRYSQLGEVWLGLNLDPNSKVSCKPKPVDEEKQKKSREQRLRTQRQYYAKHHYEILLRTEKRREVAKEVKETVLETTCADDNLLKEMKRQQAFTYVWEDRRKLNKSESIKTSIDNMKEIVRAVEQSQIARRQEEISSQEQKLKNGLLDKTEKKQLELFKKMPIQLKEFCATSEQSKAMREFERMILSKAFRASSKQEQPQQQKKVQQAASYLLPPRDSSIPLPRVPELTVRRKGEMKPQNQKKENLTESHQFTHATYQAPILKETTQKTSAAVLASPILPSQRVRDVEAILKRKAVTAAQNCTVSHRKTLRRPAFNSSGSADLHSQSGSYSISSIQDLTAKKSKKDVTETSHSDEVPAGDSVLSLAQYLFGLA